MRFCSCTRAAVPALGCGSSVPRVVHPRGPFSGSGAAMGSRRDQTRSLLGDRSACSSRQSRALAPHVGATVPALPLPSPDNHPDCLQDRQSMQSSGGTLAPAGGWCFPGRVSWTFVPAPPAPPPSRARRCSGCGHPLYHCSHAGVQAVNTPCITVHMPVFRLWTPLSHFSEGQPGVCYGLNQYAGIPTPRRVKTGPWEVTAGTTAFTGRPSELPHPSSCVRTQCEGGHPWTEAGPHQTPPASKTVRKQRLWCSAVTAQTDRDKGPGGAGVPRGPAGRTQHGS